MKGPRRLGHEPLESRVVLATFGVPWHDPSHLSLSFAPDGTSIAGHASALFAALDAQQPTEEWQRTILIAFQSWAEHANLNFGWREDSGHAFGSAGFTQGDPRFGDIRIGAQAMRPEALAIAVPPDPTLSGTLSGDVLLNSEYLFDGDPYSLLAVMLHEAGHSLGLANSDNADAVMFSRYSETRTTLSSEDIARIQALYGKRAADTYEGTLGNNTRGRASSFRLPAGYKGETPLVAFGDITKRGDVDFFAFRAPDDGDDDKFDRDVTIRLQTEGSSLLAPKVAVFDQYGRRLASQSSTSLTGDTLQIRLTGTSSQQRYFVRVEGATPDAFGVGRYGLSVRFDKTSGTPDAIIDQLLRGPFETLEPDAIDAFFRANGDTLISPEEGTNDSIGAAALPAASRGYAAGTRFEAVASLSKKEDFDFYRLTAPAGDSRVLTANVWTAAQNGFQPKVSVVDSSGNEVAAEVLVQGNGTSTVQVRDTVPGRKYFLKVELAPQATQDKGNYHLSAHFGARATPLTTFAESTLGHQDRSDSYQLYIAQPQLMSFVLSAGREDPGASVRMAIIGAAGTVVSLESRSGESASQTVLLVPGAYTVRMEVDNPNAAAISYSLRGNSESDPIGPVVADVTLTPAYTLPPMPPPNPTLPPPPPLPPFVYPGLPVPYNPTYLTGYVDPLDPSTWPPGYVPPQEHYEYSYIVLSPAPYYYLPLE